MISPAPIATTTDTGKTGGRQAAQASGVLPCVLLAAHLHFARARKIACEPFFAVSAVITLDFSKRRFAMAMQSSKPHFRPQPRYDIAA